MPSAKMRALLILLIEGAKHVLVGGRMIHEIGAFVSLF